MDINNSRKTFRWELISRVYYILKPFIPRSVQISIRRKALQNKLPAIKGIWPIDPGAGKKPSWWTGWPEGKKFAFILTHDVETSKGHDRCRELAELEMNFGFRSSFNFLLGRYETSENLRHFLTENGFEIGIHGIYHDGKKFNSRKVFMKRAKVINHYLKEWNVVGFRAPSMHCNLDWIRELDIQYDLSTFDTDPFEPKSQGVRTIFPFRVPNSQGKNGYMELPYTLPQDFTLFVLLQEKSPQIWKNKLAWIAENGGMALVNVHPDYMCFDGGPGTVEEYSASFYEEFLQHVKEEYEGEFYHVLPKDLVNKLKVEPTSLDALLNKK